MLNICFISFIILHVLKVRLFHLRKYYRNLWLIWNMCLYDLWKVKLELTTNLNFLLLLSRKKWLHNTSAQKQPNYSSEKTEVILLNFVGFEIRFILMVLGESFGASIFTLYIKGLPSSPSLSLSLCIVLIFFSPW